MKNRIYKALCLLNGLFTRKYSDKLRVLAYHTVEDSVVFDKQIHYLKNNFQIINLELLNRHLFQNFPLPEKPLLITFDDGDISIREKGLDILIKHQVPSVLFVITSLINTNKAYWWDEIRYYGENDGNRMSWEVKSWKNKERLIYLQNLIKSSTKPKLQKEQLNNSQLEQLSKAGMQIANHSHTHPMFDRCSKYELEQELRTSVDILNKLGYQPDIFAYPNGNFNATSELELKNAGIKLAFLFDHKINEKQINPLRISRIRVDSDIDLKEFKVKVSGFHSFIYHNFRKKIK